MDLTGTTQAEVDAMRKSHPHPGPIYPGSIPQGDKNYYIQRLETVAQMAADTLGILAPGIPKLWPGEAADTLAVSLTDVRSRIVRVLEEGRKSGF